MHTLKIGDVTITSIIERDGPWRRPEDMFPAYDPEIGKRHLAELDPFIFDPASGRPHSEPKCHVCCHHRLGPRRLLPGQRHEGGLLRRHSAHWHGSGHRVI